MQNFNFIEKLAENVSAKTNKPVSKEQIKNTLENILAFAFIVFVIIVFVVCFSIYWLNR